MYWTQAISLLVFSVTFQPSIYFPLLILPGVFLLALRWFYPLIELKLIETEDQRRYRYQPFPISTRKKLDDVERY
jgi:hypothetical protein